MGYFAHFYDLLKHLQLGFIYTSSIMYLSHMLTVLMGSGTAGHQLTCSGNDVMTHLLSELLNLRFTSTKEHQVIINYGPLK